MPLSNVTLLLGKEPFLKQEFLRELRSKVFGQRAGTSPNWQEFVAGKDPLNAAIDFVTTIPFLSERRLAIIREIDRFSPQEKESFRPALSRLSESSIMVLTSEQSNVKKDRFIQQLAEICRVVFCHPPFEKDLPTWIENRMRKKGQRMDRRVLFVMLERIGHDLAALDNAMEQLTIFADRRQSITEQDVETLFGYSAQEGLFHLLDYLVEKKTQKALICFESLRNRGARAPEIIGALSTQLDRLKKAADLERSGMARGSIGAQLGVGSFFQEKFFRQVKAVSQGRVLTALIERLFECDQSIKSGRVQEAIALQRLILESDSA